MSRAGPTRRTARRPAIGKGSRRPSSKPEGADDAWTVRTGTCCEATIAVARELNLELAKVEVKQKAAALGIAGGMAAAAAAVAFYAIGFGFAAAAAGLAETLSLWLSLLIVAGVLVVVTAILGVMARRYARRASTLQPSQAIEEAKQTVKELQGNG